MKFFSLHDLDTDADTLLAAFSKEQEAVLTVNGSPAALMIPCDEEHLEQLLSLVRSIRAMQAMDEMRRIAGTNGYMSDEEIEAEIKAARDEKKQQEKSA